MKAVIMVCNGFGMSCIIPLLSGFFATYNIDPVRVQFTIMFLKYQTYRIAETEL